MSDIIPAYSPTQKTKSLFQNSKGVDLAPFIIRPSSFLWRLQIFVFFVMFISATIAVAPFVLSRFYWPLLWLIFLIMIVIALRTAWREKNCENICVSITQNIWRLGDTSGEIIVEPEGDILLWSRVIVLQLRDLSGRKKYCIRIFPDSVSPDEWRRLRVFLRMGLRR